MTKNAPVYGQTKVSYYPSLDEESNDGELPKDIPRDPQLFYDDFGYFSHPRLQDPKTHLHLPVTKLAPYQYDAWKYPGNQLTIKPNKIGLTTSHLLEDFQKCLLPEYAGGEVMVGAQDQDFANSHVMDIKMMIKQSDKYSRFLIENPQQELLHEMKSKVSVAFIRNPWNPKNPSKIIAVGQNPSRVYSWKRIVHVHLSDISLMIRKEWRPYWRGIITRVANTGGKIKIETIPGHGQIGLVWQLYKLLSAGTRLAETDLEKETFVEDPEEMMPTFRLNIINVREAIQAGVITEEFLDEAKRNLGELQYQAAFDNKFLAPGNQWYKEGWFTTGGFGLQ